ncbi:sialic acid-binding Ig-like lectin 16 isoform X2 [Hyperolius riggenbachi]|uniref:sialic acid-binding Ig-like lectin 16 isoform X2 n=1 Tax=Hyperolius riggenbachi TaxID=752182 RepID=UPI0035A3C700
MRLGEGWDCLIHSIIILFMLCQDLTEKPQIQPSNQLIAGQSAKLTCLLPANCPVVSTVIQWRRSNRYGIWGTTSTITFTPTPSDHQTIVTCEMIFSAGTISAQMTLNVRYSRGHLNPGYSITVIRHVTVQEHLCVTIPCTFIADGWNTFQNSRGYWKTNSGITAAARNGYNRGTKPNFHVTGNPDNGDCTLTITDAKKEDSGTYFFLFEEPVPHSYNQYSVSVEVTDLKELMIKQSGELVAGHNVTLTCFPSGDCPGKFPAIIWRKSNLDGIWGSSSSMTFTPTPSDHQAIVTCEVTLPTGRMSAQKMLNVLHPPEIIEVNIYSSDGISIHTNGIVFIKEKESVTLNCSADGNPPASVTWTKGNGQWSAWAVYTVTPSTVDNYKCLARNKYGFIEKHIQVHLQGIPRKPEASIVTPHGVLQEPLMVMKTGDSLTCSANSTLPVTVTWLIDDEIQMNSSAGELLMNMTIGGNYRCLAWNRLGIDIRSVVVSLSDSVTNAQKASGSSNRVIDILIGMVCGIAIVIFLIVILKWITRKKRKSKTKYSSTDEPSPMDDTAVDDPSQLYMNINKAKDNRGANIQQDSRRTPADNEAVNYSTIKFSSPPTRPVSKQPETEYAEIFVR